MSVFNIAIIGCGQLGSRHLQGLAKLDIPVSIEIVDTNKESLDRAKIRFAEIQSNINISTKYCNSIEGLNDDINLCIIATNSDIRASVTEELFCTKRVENIIFEKVVFQVQEDFEKIGKMIKDKKINAWVNCVMRTYDIYKDLRKSLTPSERILFVVEGGEWGLACNAIHFMDLVCFFTGVQDCKVDVSKLDKTITNSKRENYYEVTGTLYGNFSNGSELILHSRKDSGADHIITILTDNRQIFVNEKIGKMYCAKKEEGWKWVESDIKTQYQSEVTTNIAKEILTKGTCILPSYDESHILHIPLLTSLKEHFEEVMCTPLEICPIT